ncbi:TolB family protein [Hyphobacterium indicum]|uniref:TolB family protein n=1 Tax=Hyphobacterium indicum TaxID=2162714 RepID=UPI000D64F566|nr:PD40 domain-containing protein [Hyphobacterium indicum]
MKQEFIWTAGLAALMLSACNAPSGTPAEPGTPSQDAAPAPADETPESTAAADDAEGLPETDIVLASLEWNDGLPAIAGHQIVTDAGLYDNQPAFDDQGGFYFTSETAGSQTDIHYRNAAGEVRNVTNTPGESEYSPRPSPDGRSITYIHQAPGGYGGQVYRQALDGGTAGPVHDYGPAGYYALSGDQSRMLLFALTDPFSLRWIGLDLGIEEEVTTGIGRALYTAPDGQSAYFTLEHPDGGYTINQFGFDDSAITPVFRLPGTTEDYAVFTNPEGERAWLTVSDGTLFYRVSHDSWQPVADLAALNLNGISRLAVSPDAGQLAIVVEE